MVSTRVRPFILDSGAPFHLIAKEGLPPEELLPARKASRSILMRTAGNPETSQANEVADVWIEYVQETVAVYIMLDVIFLLSTSQHVEASPYYIVIPKRGTHSVHEKTKARIKCEHITGVSMFTHMMHH